MSQTLKGLEFDMHSPLQGDAARWLVAALLKPLSEADRLKRKLLTQSLVGRRRLYASLAVEAEKICVDRIPGEVLKIVSEDARLSLLIELVERVYAFTENTLSAAFTFFFLDKSNCYIEETEDNNSDDLEEKFIESFQSGLWQKIFVKWPVILRIIYTITNNWITAISKFLIRLYEDQDIIRNKILDNAIEFEIIALELGLSDYHYSGQSVIRLTSPGSSFIYKPRDVSSEAAWAALLEWCNKNGPPIDLKAAKVVVRDGYGWMEYIAHGSCPDGQACRRFYQREGALLALCHVLGSTDMHGENLIAAGEYPVLIDLETIMTPSIVPLEQKVASAAESAVDDLIAASVQSTGLLPIPMTTSDEMIVTVGGFTGFQSALLSHQGKLDKYQESNYGLANPNIPKLNERPQIISEYVNDINFGFLNYGSFLLKNKLKMEKSSSFLDLKNSRVRFILRPTQFYATILERLSDPRNMTNGIEWSMQVEFIERLYTRTADNYIRRQERDSLLNLDIPRFDGNSNSKSIYHGKYNMYFRRIMLTPLQNAQRKISRLCEEELHLQFEALEHSLDGIGFASRGDFKTALGVRASGDNHKGSENSMSALADCAIYVADTLKCQATRLGGTASWLGREWVGKFSYQIRLGHDFYGGTTGISVFLAAYSKIFNDLDAAHLALESLSSLRSLIRGAARSHFLRVFGLGGGKGVGGLLYAFSSIGSYMNEKSLYEDAVLIADSISTNDIARDKSYDIMTGAAGCILGLLKLFKETGYSIALDKAVELGNHLLRNRPRNEPHRMWHTHDRYPLLGFSHGVSGYAYALSKLGAISGESAIILAGKECAEFEYNHFSEEHGDWPDYRQKGFEFEAPLPRQWCHGAGGIGLSRVGIQRLCPQSDHLITDLDRSLSLVAGGYEAATDSLCCGNMGNIDFLIEAAQDFWPSRFGAGVIGNNILLSVVKKAVDNGSFSWGSGADQSNLGLFSGIAGVGYTCLRAMNSSRMPSVLLFD